MHNAVVRLAFLCRLASWADCIHSWPLPFHLFYYMDRVKRIWYLSRSLARTFAARSYKQWVKRKLQTESQIPLNGWTCAVKICHDGMLEDTNSLDGAHIIHAHADDFTTSFESYRHDMAKSVFMLKYSKYLELELSGFLYHFQWFCLINRTWRGIGVQISVRSYLSSFMRQSFVTH